MLNPSPITLDPECSQRKPNILSLWKDPLPGPFGSFLKADHETVEVSALICLFTINPQEDPFLFLECIYCADYNTHAEQRIICRSLLSASLYESWGSHSQLYQA